MIFSKKVIIAFLVSLIGLAVLIGMTFLLIISVGTDDSGSSTGENNGYISVSPETMAWKGDVEIACNKYGIPDQLNIILAIIEQESGGKVGTCDGDIMQASGSQGYPPGTITDPLMSIDMGVSYYGENYKLAFSTGVYAGRQAEDIAIQGYNYGIPYVTYALEAGGYSLESAYSYSAYMATLMGWDSYGDPDYVTHVREYLVPNT